MANKFKVWIEIEVQDEEGEPVGEGADHGVLPDSLGQFDTLDEARARIWEIVKDFCPDAENSDSHPDKTAG